MSRVLTLFSSIPLAVALSACAPAPGAREPASQATTAASRPPAVLGGGAGVNVLRNPGFEQGREHWTTMGTENWGAFEVVGAPVHAGAQAAKLVVRTEAGQKQPPSRVFGVVQEVRETELPGGFPETLSGWYRIENWTPPPPGVFQYLQVVVIAWGDPRTARLVGDPIVKNYQVRFMLSGSETAPFNMSNAKYDFTASAPPEPGRWVRFEIPVRKRFQELWGVVPTGTEFLRVLFEARWDHRPDSAAIDATVVYDDLFFGYGSAGDVP